MKRYHIEFRQWDSAHDDIDTVSADVEGESLHAAIGSAWPEMQRAVESFGGTIDDLDGWEATPPMTMLDMLIGKGFRVIEDETIPPHCFSVNGHLYRFDS